MASSRDTVLYDALVDATYLAFKKAEIEIPPDVLNALLRARNGETDPVACSELDNILANIREAKHRSVPVCQDTGVPVVYLSIPATIPLTPSIYQAVCEGVSRATEMIPLRPNVVNPITRENTGNNCGTGIPAIHVAPGTKLSVTAFPKGAGSENVSRTTMLLPSDKEGIERFVVETMLQAGGKPCPPVILGVGIGSTFDGVAAIAKEALLLPVDTMTAFEQRLCDSVNELGIGPMGLGGKITALAVKVRMEDCHTASLPIAVNVQCWACRRATVEVNL